MMRTDIRKILVIRLDRIGDVVCSLPVVEALRINFPASFIAFMTTPYTKDLVFGNRDIDEVVVYDRGMGFFEKIKFFKRLRDRGFDTAIILSPYFESAFIAYLSRAGLRLGYPRDPVSHLKHEIEACLDVIRPLGIVAQGAIPRLETGIEAEKIAEEFMLKHHILDTDILVGIHPGASQGYRRWAKECFMRLIDRLSEKTGVKVVLFCGKPDMEIVGYILKSVKRAPIVCGPELKLEELAAMSKRCKVFLGNSSGPVHVASAAGTPTVTIFGNMHPLDSEFKWAPRGEKNIVVRKKLDCLGCHPAKCHYHKCLKELDVEDVFSAVKKCL